MTTRDVLLAAFGAAIGGLLVLAFSWVIRNWPSRRDPKSDSNQPTSADWQFKLALLFAGVAFLLATALLSLSEAQRTVPYGIGVALLVGAGYSLLERMSRTDPASLVATRVADTADDIIGRMRLEQDIYETGLDRVLPQPHALDIFKDVSNANYIDMMYNTGQTVAITRVPDIVNAIVEHGCKVRILICNPNKLHWTDDDEEEVSKANGITDVLKEIKLTMGKLEYIEEKLRKEGGEKRGGTIEVRQYDFVPQCSMLLVNNSYVWVTPYLPYRKSSEVPVLKVSREWGTLFHTYEQVYDEVWRRSNPKLRFPAPPEIERTRSESPNNGKPQEAGLSLLGTLSRSLWAPVRWIH